MVVDVGCVLERCCNFCLLCVVCVVLEFCWWLLCSFLLKNIIWNYFYLDSRFCLLIVNSIVYFTQWDIFNKEKLSVNIIFFIKFILNSINFYIKN